MEGWITSNWLALITALGVIGGLLFSGITHHADLKSRRIQNLLMLTRSHRELWSELLNNPALKRVLDASAATTNEPVTFEEKLFLNLVIQHLSSAYVTMNKGRVVGPEKLARDVGLFFSLPIPHKVWEENKPLQNDNFVRFVDESCRTCSTQ